MAKEKTQMPQSTAGLIRYDDSASAKIKISPKVVIAATVAFSVFIVILNVVA